ncbi:two-component response regulator-like APRR5 isoform X2 [Spinacia oleracea]|uniref:Two-component response regulator-like APRR5 isoform X2 n=1 Tax=Spinacia oleracea TaxID=3562 RepID=A0A9R0J1I3_SPIOL|nr:two-component response regulator-like APRR5 isoform X2 [Spinacia oleracea]
MGEVVVSSEDELEIMEIVKEEELKKKKDFKEGSSSTMARLENVLPKLGLRILLVEDDDSTRQLIAALLRKCSYKVAAVADGLKAWEILKARPHNIDLILTEAELPSISGYALLTLIREHEICKNIPVIMMSTHDSIGMVYKCMLKGAADFLVKPIRINELKNLWQHVWRRQSLNREGLGPQDESVAQEKLEATAENNSTSDHSSSSKTCTLGQELINKKGSDAQVRNLFLSSCGNPDLDDESTDMAEVEDYSQPKQGISPDSELILQKHSNFGNSSHNLRTSESAVAGSDTAACNSNNAINEEQRRSPREDVNICTEANDNTDVHPNFSREAIDLIGSLDSNSRHNACANDGGDRSEPCQQLDLTLRRFFPGTLENKSGNENQMLNHSNASAFTRYVNKPSQMSNSNPTSVVTLKDYRVNSGDLLSDNTKNSMSPYDRKVISLPTSLAKEVENEYRTASEKLFPMGGRQVDVSPMTSVSPSPSSANQQQTNSYHQFSIDMINGIHHYHVIDQSTKPSSNQPMSMQQDQTKQDSLEERAHFSSAADQSTSGSLHNDTGAGTGHLNCGISEGGNDQSHVTQLTSQRSLQREAALNKFRLKRKERCYEKKVRYESRKKLAEQRPRVKGQFVRQVPPDPPPQMSDNSGGISTAN